MLKFKYYFNEGCHCCQDMKPIIHQYAEDNGIPIEEIDARDAYKMDMPQELKGLPFIELYDDNERLEYFQGSTKREIIDEKFGKWVKKNVD